jgi:hypothetical protein
VKEEGVGNHVILYRQGVETATQTAGCAVRFAGDPRQLSTTDSKAASSTGQADGIPTIPVPMVSGGVYKWRTVLCTLDELDGMHLSWAQVCLGQPATATKAPQRLSSPTAAAASCGTPSHPAHGWGS